MSLKRRGCAVIQIGYQSRFGLARAAIFQGGRPYLYLEGYVRDPSPTLWGAVAQARLSARVGGVPLIILSDGSEAVLDGPRARLEAIPLGQKLKVQIIAEGRAGKRPRARICTTEEGGLTDLKSRILALSQALLSPDAPQPIEDQDHLIAQLDEAEAGALSPSGALDGGGFLSLESTRALIACDVDMGDADAGLIHTAQSKARSINEAAIKDVGRRLQLSGLGGLVIVDLIGRRIDAERMKKLLCEGFSLEAAKIATGGAGRFGTYEFTRPWVTTPPNDAARWDYRLARQLLWQAAQEASHDGGRMITLTAPGAVADILQNCLKQSLDPISPRLKIEIAPVAKVIGS